VRPDPRTAHEMPSEPDADLLAARYGTIAAIGVVGLAVVLRLPDLFVWWVNPDEGIYFGVLTQERLGAFWSEVFATAHPPLYFLILRAMGLIATDVAWLRSLAFVCGCAAVWVFILIGRDVGGTGARGWIMGLAAGLLLAASPVAVELSQVIRPYMLLILLLALSLHFLLRYLQRPSLRPVILYTVCASLAVLVHYSAALALGVFAMLVVADGIRRGVGRMEWRRLAVVQVIPGAIFAVLYVVQLRRLMVSTDPEFSVETWLSAYLIHTPIDVWLTLVGFHSSIVGRAGAVSATFVTLIALVAAARNREAEIFLAVGGGLLVATACAALELYPFGAGRHSAWLFPFVILGLASGLASVLRGARPAAVVASAIVAGLLLRAPLGAERAAPALAEHVVRNEHVAAMAAALDAQKPPRVVVMSVETYRLLLPLYHAERQRARTSPDGLFSHFRWGIRDVIVLPGLDVSVLPEQMGQPNHLYGGTRRAARELDVALPANGQPVLVLSGAWRRSVFELADLARREGLSAPAQMAPSLIAIALDLEAYGRALEDLPGPP